jgi:hypothetical protein
MRRRDFVKGVMAVPAVAHIPALHINTKYTDNELNMCRDAVETSIQLAEACGGIYILAKNVEPNPLGYSWSARPFLYQLRTIQLELRGVVYGTRAEAYCGADCEPAAAG